MWKWFEAQEKIEERSMEGSAYLSSTALRVPSDHEVGYFSCQTVQTNLLRLFINLKIRRTRIE